MTRQENALPRGMRNRCRSDFGIHFEQCNKLEGRRQCESPYLR